MRRLRLLPLLALLVAASSAPADAGSPEPFEPLQWSLATIDARAAWDLGPTGAGAVIAVVDSGIDVDHPEFAGSKLVAPANCIGAASPAACTRGRAAVDDVVEHPNGTTTPGTGHGTHVAGIAAAPLNGAGIVGVAPSARVMPVRVLDGEGNGSSGDVATGIRYAIQNGAHVINLSLGQLPVVSQLSGLGVLDRELADAIDEAVAHDIVVVVAAGNDSVPLCSYKVFENGSGLCVGATDRFGQRAAYSNFGSGVDLVAPGGNPLALCSQYVLSTDLLTTSTNCGPDEPGYGARAGTSMAAPHVAGVAALLWELGLVGQVAVDRMLATTEDLGVPGRDPVFGRGQVNARRAVADDEAYIWVPVER